MFDRIELGTYIIASALVGKKIRIDGFMVPLEFDYGEALTVEEFVLVPDAGMCIHVPPPPPNQMIFVIYGDKNAPQKTDRHHGSHCNTCHIQRIYGNGGPSR